MSLGKLTTEVANARTTSLDAMPVDDMLAVMNDEDHRVAQAVQAALPEITRAVEVVSAALRRGGRLIYLGAGTSGRIGLLDAVECPPTFGTDPALVVGVLAGGPQAFTGAVEGAEDDPQMAAHDLRDISLTRLDVVVGLTASGRTPYVIGGLEFARSLGTPTVSVACNLRAECSAHADVAIEVDSGPEILTGSTRLKAGTAQKMVCNMISTAAMVQIGKVYGNLMIDVQPTNAKLIDRCHRIVAAATGADAATVAAALEAAGGQPKTASVMILRGCDRTEARRLLQAAQGSVRAALAHGTDGRGPAHPEAGSAR